MALLTATIKTFMLALVCSLATAMSAGAASFTMKRGLNLDTWTTWTQPDRWGDRDAMLPFPEWRRSMGEAELAQVKDAGFDFVRMPVDPSPFLTDDTLPFRGDLLASILESARLINRAGLKVVVDLHLTQSSGNGAIGMEQVMADPAIFERYLDLVRTVGKAFAAEDPSRVALELMNEPVVDCESDGTNLWPQRLRQLFAAARASATRLTLVLSGACYSSGEALARTTPGDIPDDNVIWTFHSYQPFLLTHQGATWAGDFVRYVTGLPYPLTAVPRAELDNAIAAIRKKIEAEAPWSRRTGMIAYLDEQLSAIDTEAKLKADMEAPFKATAAWASANGIKPENIMLGEFGMIRQEYGNPHVVPGRYRAAYVRDMIGIAESYGFSWAIWGYGGAFGVVDAFDGKKAEPDVMNMMRTLAR